MNSFDKLTDLNNKLTELLKEPEPGLAMWQILVRNIVKEMNEIYEPTNRS